LKERDRHRSANPRRERKKNNDGKLSLGEQRVFERLERIGHKHRDSDGNLKHDIEVDSLMESAFNSTQNEQWDDYKQSQGAPPASEVSRDDIVLVKASQSDDSSEGHHILCESGSEISQDNSFSSSDNEIESSDLKAIYTKNNEEYDFYKNKRKNPNEKFQFFKVVEGMKLPLKKGMKGRTFAIDDMIDISGFLIQRKMRQQDMVKYVSNNTIQQILVQYQTEMKAIPLDLMKGLQLSGYLILNNYPLGYSQLQALACTIPYI